VYYAGAKPRSKIGTMAELEDTTAKKEIAKCCRGRNWFDPFDWFRAGRLRTGKGGQMKIKSLTIFLICLFLSVLGSLTLACGGGDGTPWCPPCEVWDRQLGRCVYNCIRPCEGCITGQGCKYACEPSQCQGCIQGYCQSTCEPNNCQKCVDGRCVSDCNSNLCQECDGKGNCKSKCDPNNCQSCVDGQCKSTCDPNLCQECDGHGHCKDRCDPNACESCVFGECSVCADDPELTCINGNCCCAPNGCGACDGTQYSDNPTGCDGTSFLDACNAHDSCYGTCGSNKNDCDDTFRYAMEITVCAASSCKVSCVINAETYYYAVASGGGGAYQDAQNCSCGN